jgi:N-acetyl sugar amidotransferase
MEYRVCRRCVMDTTDPEIAFDEDGICNHCHGYDRTIKEQVLGGDRGKERLELISTKIREDGRKKEYDCIIGVSGGVDSTYVAYAVRQIGLRPLAVHLDNGWDSELAVWNIQQTLEKLGIDLYTHVIDWGEFKDLQLSFLRASTPDSEIPTDHAIVSLLHQKAQKEGVKYVIDGCNARTESHLPRAWSQGHLDWRYIRTIQRLFGTARLKTFPHMDLLSMVRYRFVHQRISILNYMDYNKGQAKELLNRELGWRDYGWKHFESIYTRFYQGYILPKKFGFDKRKMHYSSLICSGEMSQDEALSELKNDPYPKEMQEADREYVIKKLGLTEAEFKEIMERPKKSFWDYKSYEQLYRSRMFQPALATYRFARDRKSGSQRGGHAVG